jgi:predicted nucleic acid-binding protein
VIVPDSSVWIEFFRATGSPMHLTARRIIEEGTEIGTTEVVVMEVLAGARNERDLRRLRSVFVHLPILQLEGLVDFEEGAALFRTCRRAGETIRKLTDCLIAAPVIRADAELLHNDADFDAIARHSDLRIHPLDR